ncbi:hypothetical protein BC628DRAFT_1402032 [Trametes gibbosa]|nr:hypothetical protein BC628DRAFT_1402032 [Trametes gibbosa]
MSTAPPCFYWFLFIPDAPSASTSDAHIGVKLHIITNGRQGDEKRWAYDDRNALLCS